MSDRDEAGDEDPLTEAATRAGRRGRHAESDPEPSLGQRLGYIGLLGWLIVLPILLGVLLGRWLDDTLGTGIQFTSLLLMLGAALGMWVAWRWMQEQ